jgi:hypothetical protein
MSLYVQNGSLLKKDDALGTSQGCCCAGCTLDEDCYYICLPGDTSAVFSNGNQRCCRTSEVNFTVCGTVTFLGVGFLNGVEQCLIEYADCPPEFEYLEGIGFMPDVSSNGCCCENECVVCAEWWCVDGTCVDGEGVVPENYQGGPYCSEAVCNKNCDNEFP